MADTPWTHPLAELRAALAGRRDERGQVGSLSWLEAEVRARGGNGATVRNILYRDVGKPDDKRVLLAVLRDLGEAAGVQVPLPEVPGGEAEAGHLLDREKRRVYRRFLAELRRGHVPRVVLVAKPGAGKTILLDHLSRALPGALRARFEHDFAPEVARLAAALGLPAQGVADPLSQLEPGAPYAVSGTLQWEATRGIVRALRESGRCALLLRVGTAGTLGGQPLRLRDGTSATPAAWIWHHFLAPLAGAELPVLATLSDAEGLPPDLTPYGEAQVLAPPTLEDARRFVRAKLPELPPGEVEGIVRRAGRDYDALGLLTLLSAVGQGGPSGEGNREPLPLPDRDLRPFLEVLHVALPPPFPDAREELIEVLLDPARPKPLAQRRDLERAFLEGAASGRVRLTNAHLVERLVLTGEPGLEARLGELEERAARLALGSGDRERALHHALRGRVWEVVLAAADGTGTVEAAWKAVQGAEDVPPGVLEAVARGIVEHYAALGRYPHPAMQAALAALEGAPEVPTRVWAGVKRAEGLIDAARFDEARALLAGLGVGEGQEGAHLDPATRIELALGDAAFARWEGRVRDAEAHLTRAAQLLGEEGGVLGGRVRLWRGIVAKDLGEWGEAARALGALADDDRALHLQRARARYQLGDLWMRLGQQGHARRELGEAIEGLSAHHAAPDEVSRAHARLGSVLRRCGELEAAGRAFAAASECAPDPFTRARAHSEAVLLHAACGRYDLALRLGDGAWRHFRDAEGQRPLESVYRRHRVVYRVALTYVCRGLGRPYLPPLAGAVRDHPDLAHARALLTGVLGELRAEGAERDAALHMDVELALSLATPDAGEAAEHARRALGCAAHPYHHFQARTYLAEALLRAGHAGEALAEVNLAHAHARAAARLVGEGALDDPAFAAWLLTLEAESLVASAPEAARQTFEHALAGDELRPFRTGIALRALHALGPELPGVLPEGPGILRPGDAARSRHG